MFCTLKDKAFTLNLRSHALATLAAFAAFRGTQTYLDVLYARSGFPVDFATGQLAFDGATILGYYDAMRAGGTMGIYVQTQLFDFAFIASVIAFGILLGTLIARLGTRGSAAQKMGIGATWFAFAGGSFDAGENVMSFVMMQFSASIPQVLALIYSSFAALKFASLTLAMLLAALALIAGIVGKLMKRTPEAA